MGGFPPGPYPVRVDVSSRGTRTVSIPLSRTKQFKKPWVESPSGQTEMELPHAVDGDETMRIPSHSYSRRQWRCPVKSRSAFVRRSASKIRVRWGLSTDRYQSFWFSWIS